VMNTYPLQGTGSDGYSFEEINLGRRILVRLWCHEPCGSAPGRYHERLVEERPYSFETGDYSPQPNDWMGWVGPAAAHDLSARRTLGGEKC